MLSDVQTLFLGTPLVPLRKERVAGRGSYVTICRVAFCRILSDDVRSNFRSYPILSLIILSYPSLTCRILSYPVVPYRILSYFVVSCRILSKSNPIQSYPSIILSYPILSLWRISNRMGIQATLDPLSSIKLEGGLAAEAP